MGLARLVGRGALGGAYIAVTLHAGRQVAEGLAVYLLRTRPLRLLRAVTGHRPHIEGRVRAALRWASAGVWLAGTLLYVGLLDPAVEALRAGLGARWQWGPVGLSLGDLLQFALTVWAAFALSALIRFLLAEDVYPRLALARGIPLAVSSLLHYALLLGGFTLAVAALGVDLTRATILAGAFGVGLGFGLQNLVSNFASGLILLLERPIHVGDSVQIGDLTGEVRRIGMRSSTVRTFEGAEVIVPNTQLVSDRVTNWTLSDRSRRLDLPVGVAYGTDPERVLDLLREVGRKHPRVRAEPAPQALFLGFGESALSFELRVWIDRFEEGLEIRSALNLAIHAALAREGIEIPFPQRDLRIRAIESPPAGRPWPPGPAAP